MPTPIRPTAKAGTSVAKPVSYVKFSDKLTDSLNDIGRMIQDHKNMIDTIQEIALELTNSIGSLDLRYPEVTAAQRQALAEAQRQLMKE